MFLSIITSIALALPVVRSLGLNATCTLNSDCDSGNCLCKSIEFTASRAAGLGTRHSTGIMIGVGVALTAHSASRTLGLCVIGNEVLGLALGNEEVCRCAPAGATVFCSEKEAAYEECGGMDKDKGGVPSGGGLKGPSPSPTPTMDCLRGVAAEYAQCGGIDNGNNGASWDGPTCCTSGFVCCEGNIWYSQCRPTAQCSLSEAPSQAPIPSTTASSVPGAASTPVPTPALTPVPTQGASGGAGVGGPEDETPQATTKCPFSSTALPSSFDQGCKNFITASSHSCGQNLCGNCMNPGNKHVLLAHTQEVLGFAHHTSHVWVENNQAGYFVSTDIAYTDGADPTKYAYMCMDWTVGTKRMVDAERAYMAETGDEVHLGVGTDGCAQTSNMGGCYRITYGRAGAGSVAESRDLIVQSVNSGSDVHCPQFDLQVGVGGQGIHNNCVGGTAALFDGSQADMGERYGGWRNKEECAQSPTHLRNSTLMQEEGDNLITLCELSFSLNMRGEDGLNSRIIEMSQVTCPRQLTAITGFRRADQDHLGFQHNFVGEHRSNPTDDCGFNIGGDGINCLSRMMDCRKPSGSFRDNVDVENMCLGMKVLPSCTNDGYTRIISDCGMQNCWA